MGTTLEIFFAVTDVLTSKLARFLMEIIRDLQQNISYKQKRFIPLNTGVNTTILLFISDKSNERSRVFGSGRCFRRV
jgi:hypothetical protein